MNREDDLLLLALSLVLIFGAFLLFVDPPQKIPAKNETHLFPPPPPPINNVLPNDVAPSGSGQTISPTIDVSNQKQVCNSLCNFKKSVMGKIDKRLNDYVCVCENGFEQVIGKIA